MWTILASKFTANSALRQGGGIFAKDGLNITLYGSDYLSNNARDEGGGVCAMVGASWKSSNAFEQIMFHTAKERSAGW